MCAIACVWKSEDNFGELVFSFHHVVPEYLTQVLGLATAFDPLAISVAWA